MDELNENEAKAWLSSYKDELWSYAMSYIEAGLSFMPIRLSTKTPAITWTDRQHRKTDEDDVNDWLENGVPDGEGGVTSVFGWGIITGEVSNLVVVDCDNQDALTYAVNEMGLWSLLNVKTTRGVHLYFSHPGNRVQCKVGGTGLGWPNVPGLDLRGDGGYVLAPPSVKFGADGTGIVHKYAFNCPDGEITQFLSTLPAWKDVTISEHTSVGSVDDWSFDNLSLLGVRTYGANVWDQASEHTTKLSRKMVSGDGRNAWITRYLGECISSGMEDDQARDAGHAFEAEFFAESLPVAEFEATLLSVVNSDKRNHPEKYAKKEKYDNANPTRQGRSQALRLINASNIGELKKLAGGQEYLLNPFIAPQSITQVVGFNGHGKSLVLLLMMWAAARGESAGPCYVKAPVRVLYMDFESSVSTLADRVAFYGDVAGDISENLTIWSASASGMDINMSTPEGLEAFSAIINEIKPQIVVIDTVRQAWIGMEENAPAAWTKVNAMAMACRNAGSSVVMVHHRNKPNQNGHGREAGSTAQLKDLDTQIFVTKVVIDKDEATREAAIPNEVTSIKDGHGRSMTSWEYLHGVAPTGHKVKAVFQLTFGKMRSTSENHVTTYIALTQHTVTGEMGVASSLTPLQKAIKLHAKGRDATEISALLDVPVSQINRWIK